MKGIIRKTGEEITIVTYHSRTDRDNVLDYVSYIDSKGEDHPREKMNLYWDVEVINEQMELARQNTKTVTLAERHAKESADKALTKREAVALAIYSSIISGLFARGNGTQWGADDVANTAASFTSEFMERFVKEE